MYTYAERSPFTSLTVGGRLDAILGAASKALKGANLHVVRAFIVGSIDACLRNGTSSDVEAGAAEVVHVYGLMQKQHPDFKVGLIEELAEAVRQKRATAWLNISVKKT